MNMKKEDNNSFNFKNLPWRWILLGITLWFLFPWIYSVLFDFIIRNPESYGSRFGAVGDIYGSLNAFVSSAALCAVAYSTWLQVTSLKETREANERQLKLAKDAHIAQIKESQHAVFTTKFYGLLNFKNEKFHHLAITANDGKQYSAYAITEILAAHFTECLESKWNDVESVSRADLKKEYLELIKTYNSIVVQLFSYFLIYGDIIKLIIDSDISKKEKEFFKSVLSNSMVGQEQILILWLGAFYREIGEFLENSELITQFYADLYVPFAKKFHKASHFKMKKWKVIFND